MFSNVHLPGAAEEHLVLIRQMARLQSQMSQLMKHHSFELQQWQDRLMRQSVRLLLERTRAQWHITDGRDSGADSHTDAHLDDQISVHEADLLICQTGCVMDGFHWRDGARCKRTNLNCQLMDVTPCHLALPTTEK